MYPMWDILRETLRRYCSSLCCISFFCGNLGSSLELGLSFESDFIFPFVMGVLIRFLQD